MTFRKSGGVVHAIRTGEPGAAVVPTADFDKALAAALRIPVLLWPEMTLEGIRVAAEALT